MNVLNATELHFKMVKMVNFMLCIFSYTQIPSTQISWFEKDWPRESLASWGVWVYFWVGKCYIFICKDSWKPSQPGVPHTIQDKNTFDLAEAALGSGPAWFPLPSLLRPALQSCLMLSIRPGGWAGWGESVSTNSERLCNEFLLSCTLCT